MCRNEAKPKQLKKNEWKGNEFGTDDLAKESLSRRNRRENRTSLCQYIYRSKEITQYGGPKPPKSRRDCHTSPGICRVGRTCQDSNVAVLLFHLWRRAPKSRIQNIMSLVTKIIGGRIRLRSLMGRWKIKDRCRGGMGCPS